MSEPTPRTFAEVVNNLRYGALADELTAELMKLNRLCADSKKPGTLTLSIKLKPGNGGQMEVFDEVSVKQPKPARGSSIMFSTEDGYLQRTDPRQQTLPLRAVEHAPEPLRVTPETALATELKKVS